MSDWTKKEQPATKGVVELVVPSKDQSGQHRKDNNGNFKHQVKFKDDAVLYGIATKDAEARTWPVGQEVEYIPAVIQHNTDESKSFNTASLVKKDSPYRNRGAGPAPKSDKDYYAEGIMTAAKVASQLTIMKEGGKPEEFPVYFKSALNAIKTELKQILGE